ncbi:hypothetical protein RJ641_027878 [Dillenia turbinata]|uniref:Protein downstream neighbor of Son n=1 Tax=Dillenia turbinata TaxID=194707 RepID=A0AAN8W648_9MAGN
MAEVAEIQASNPLYFVGGGGGGDAAAGLKVRSAGKRKTPSELRGEQLKRSNFVELADEPSAPLHGSMKITNGLKKMDSPKIPRYIETRVDEVYPVRKSTSRLRLLAKKENAKENVVVEQTDSLRKQSTPSNLADNSMQHLRLEGSVAKDVGVKDDLNQACQFTESSRQNTSNFASRLSLASDGLCDLATADVDMASKGAHPRESPASPYVSFDGLKNALTSSELDAHKRPQSSCMTDSHPMAAFVEDGEKCSQSTFRSVAELSLGSERPCVATVDMDKALRGLGAPEFRAFSSLPGDAFAHSGHQAFAYSQDFCPKVHISGQKAPLDLTLKTNMRVVSSSSVNWFHRLSICGTYDGTAKFVSHLSSGDQSGASMTEVNNARSLYSWVYPQASLPPSVISALNLASTEGGEIDFLRKRHLAWEESFRSLYYLFRKKICSIFYVCTTQFLVMFTGGHGSGSSKSSCNAYISQSTRSLRSLLREHDVGFSMPLCLSKVEQATTEDLVELSEIERSNLGQTRHLNSISDIDNSPESLLAFNGNSNVHGLYDILLNYRSFLTSLTGMDVPLLYSPVPFKNAAMSAPEVKCKEMRRADHIAFSSKGSYLKEGKLDDDLSAFCYSIEIKDAYLPPWIVSSMCAIVGSEGRSFEASFVTESTSTGLNVAFETIGQKNTETGAGECPSPNTFNTFGIADTVFTPALSCGLLKGLKYCNNSYTAFLSPQ